MKKLNLIEVLLLSIMAFFVINTAGNAQELNASGLQIRLKGGIGQTLTALPTRFDEVTIINPVRQITTTKSDLENYFLKTKWGPYGGLNLDLYLTPRVGFGLDGDVFFNKLEFLPHERLEDFLVETSLNEFVESNRKDQSFFFAGVGPSFKLVKTEKFDVDLNIRGGLGFLQMGSLDVSIPELQTAAAFAGALIREEILEYDYSKMRIALGAKAGLYLNYWFNSWIGLTAGADLIHSFVSNDRLNNNGSYTLKYKDPDFFNTNNGDFDNVAYFYVNNSLDDYPAGKMNVNHFGVSVGLVFRFGGGGSRLGILGGVILGGVFPERF